MVGAAEEDVLPGPFQVVVDDPERARTVVTRDGLRVGVHRHRHLLQHRGLRRQRKVLHHHRAQPQLQPLRLHLPDVVQLLVHEPARRSELALDHQVAAAPAEAEVVGGAMLHVVLHAAFTLEVGAVTEVVVIRLAGAVLAALPVMLLYFVAQRFMVQGITAGSVKG